MQRRYVYNHSKCGRCGSQVSTWDMNARKVYACETCQPLRADTVITPARAQALRAGRPTKVRQQDDLCGIAVGAHTVVKGLNAWLQRWRHSNSYCPCSVLLVRSTG